MVTYLKYYHINDVKFNSAWRRWVLCWFGVPGFHGTSYGNRYPIISVTNWDDVKHKLPFWRRPKLVMDSEEYALYLKIKRISQELEKNGLI